MLNLLGAVVQPSGIKPRLFVLKPSMMPFVLIAVILSEASVSPSSIVVAFSATLSCYIYILYFKQLKRVNSLSNACSVR